jgi:haloalkane dehalogenase
MSQKIQNEVPEWLDVNEYPFVNHYVEIDGYNIHYIDEGQGEILLMIHGIPDWSFGFRNLVKDLSKNYRCIALDHIGFGLSDKPEDADYSIQAQAARLEKFVSVLGLKNINLLVHDFGGPIGLSYAINHPDNVKRIIISQTWMWSLADDKHFTAPAKMLNSWFGRFLYLNMNFSVNFMMKQSYADKSKLKPHYDQYKKAQGSPKERKATYALAKDLNNAWKWYDSLWQKRQNIQSQPALILWAMKDKFFPAGLMLPKWKETLPLASTAKLENSGHFFQEEAAAEATKIIRQFIR